MSSKLAIVDSSIYISLFRSGRFAEQLIEINKKFLLRNSSIVLLELYAGASLKKERRLVSGMEKDFAAILPAQNDWTEAGKVLNVIRKKHGFDSRKMRDLVNDVLIAMSARTNGATVITNNAGDFRLIQEIRPFDMILLY